MFSLETVYELFSENSFGVLLRELLCDSFLVSLKRFFTNTFFGKTLLNDFFDRSERLLKD